MDLLGLPLELLERIFHETILVLGTKGTARIRLVNKAFDGLSLNALISLPSFEDAGPWDSGFLQPHPRMPAALMERLILLKLQRRDADRRPLAYEIQRTARHISGRAASFPLNEQQWQGRLARLAAETLSVRDVVRYVALSPSVLSEPDLELNELICCLAVEGRLAETYFYLVNTRNDTRTAFFGDLLSAAVQGGKDVLENILRTLPKPKTKLDRLVRIYRLGAALVLAVELNKADIVDALLRHDAGVARWQSRHFERALFRACELGHLPCVQVLHRWLGENRSHEYVWEKALRLAIQNGHDAIVRFIVPSWDRISVAGTEMRGSALEDACASGSVYALEFLSKYAIYPPVLFSAKYNAVYWAGRSGYADALRALLERHEQDWPNPLAFVLDALAGAAFHSPEAVNCVLEHVGCSSVDVKSTGTGIDAFASAVDRVMARKCPKPTLSSSTDGSRTTELAAAENSSCPHDPLLESIADIRLRLLSLMSQPREISVQDVYAYLSSPPAAEMRLCDDTLCNMATKFISQNRPGLFMLIWNHVGAERHMRWCAGSALGQKSKAVYQALLDAGWDLNAKLGNGELLPLPRTAGNRRLARWFLKHGADPNAFDGDPTSRTQPGMSLIAKGVETMKLYAAYGGDVQRGHLLHGVENVLDSLIWLLDHNVPVNKPQDMYARLHHGAHWFSTGVTPLMLAAGKAGPEACELLLRHGADLSLRTGHGETALDLAWNRPGHPEIIELLTRWQRQNWAEA